LGVLVYVTLAALLRTREVYADTRAAQWEGSTGALAQVFGAAQASAASGSRWRRVWRFHPEVQARLQVLKEPERLLEMGFWEAVGTGIAASLAVQSVLRLLVSVQNLSPHVLPTYTWQQGPLRCSPRGSPPPGCGEASSQSMPWVWRHTVQAGSAWV
jgi:hypothetical protein